MADTVKTLAEKITDAIEVFVSNEPTYSRQQLKIKVDNVIREFKTAGPYRDNPTYYSTDEIIEEDLEANFYGDIFECALFDFNQIGAEGQTQHTESDITRHYADRNKYFANVCRGARF